MIKKPVNTVILILYKSNKLESYEQYTNKNIINKLLVNSHS